MHGKTMREALQEARDYRDDTNEGGPGSGPQKGGKKQSSADIKKAYGILNDPRYKQGNYSGAAKAIDKLSPGLSNHPDVKNAMKRANEESQITEKKAEFLRLDFKNKNEVEKLEGWMYKFISQVNAPYDSVVFNKHRLDGFSVEFEGMDDADALMTKLKRAGFRFKVDMREDAPANATGTAVAGTGDDSSTVVVRKKKKKPMQDKLMRRLGITETIDRVIPDLEYEVDEITSQVNKLKEMAINKNDKSNIQAKKLPYDKDTDQPKKYVAGLSDKDKAAHDKHLEKGSKKSDSDKSAYKQSPADKKAKTKTSVHTKKYKQMFGEGDLSLDEAIKGLQKKAEKSGMPYSILKQVYNRGMAAWKGGHRPGTTPQQWAFARVNSFITKSSGTWGKADSDLAKKVRGQ